MSRPRAQARGRAASPLGTWFAGPAALARFRRRVLGRAPAVLPPRDGAWRGIAPGFATVIAMAEAGAPFQIALARRYDRSGEARRLRPALAAGATVFLPQAHQLLPRLMRLMAALRAGLLGPPREECSFLFAVEGRGRAGLGLHHDGPVQSFWLQLEGRRTVTVGPPVRPGTPQDLPGPPPHGARGWRTLDLTPGTLFHLPAWTPHEVVCRRRSLAVSLTWRLGRAGARRTAAAPGATALVAWDVVSGRAAPRPRASRTRLWTQVPVLVLPARGNALVLLTPAGCLALPASLRRVAARLAEMPSLPVPASARGRAALRPLLERGILAPHDLPLRIVPDRPGALDGWRFA